MGLEIGFFAGAAILLAAMVYGVVSSRRRNRANDAVTEQATSELYRDQSSYEGKEDELRARTRP